MIFSSFYLVVWVVGEGVKDEMQDILKFGTYNNFKHLSKVLDYLKTSGNRFKVRGPKKSCV